MKPISDNTTNKFHITFTCNVTIITILIIKNIESMNFKQYETTWIIVGITSHYLIPYKQVLYFSDKTPLGGILNDTKHGWLALGPKFCVVDLRTGLKVAARTFGPPYR